MKLVSTRTHLAKSMEFPGLISGGINYEIKGGTSTTKYEGPKLTREVWNEILMFFKDTYDRTKSECQVRLYVNTTTRTWAAWAYPQKLRSYMSTDELQTPEATAQREQFKSSEGWMYLGTVHHHCGASAFQSGADRQNETNQDGLHITVGKMDSPQYDIHVRFYLAGSEFLPDLSEFWDIGDDARRMIPKEVHDIVARHQMTMPAPDGTTYPAQWRENLIDPPPTPARSFENGDATNGVGSVPNSFGHGGNLVTGFAAHNSGKKEAPTIKRREWALTTLRGRCRAANITPAEMDRTLEEMESSRIVSLMRSVAAEYSLSISDIILEWAWDKQQQDAADQAGYGNYGV